MNRSAVTQLLFADVTTVDDRQRARTAYLLALYESTDGNPTKTSRVELIGERIGIARNDAVTVAKWLVDRRFAAFPAFGGPIALTPSGADEAERLLRGGAVPALPVLVLSVEERRAVEVFLRQYRLAEGAGEFALAGDAQLEADAEIRTIDAQLRSPKPKRRVIRASLVELHALLQGAAGSGLWSVLEHLLLKIG